MSDKVQVLVLRAAGINCDRETEEGFRMAGAEPFSVHVNRLKADASPLDHADILVIPGGFSYGDSIAAGTILASELRHGLREPLARFVAGGKLVLGICNGFQTLTKAGLLPGFEPFEDPPRATVTFNESDRYEDRWVAMRVESGLCPLFPEGHILEMPVGHGEGRFVAHREVIERLEAAGQIVLRYVDREGKTTGYPWNPNGSVDHIAGICDPTGRIVGLMPHPDRHLHPYNHPRWTRDGLQETADGLAVFSRAVRYARERRQGGTSPPPGSKEGEPTGLRKERVRT
jgi:phosphoribosylformylglycinamidine synthase